MERPDEGGMVTTPKKERLPGVQKEAVSDGRRNRTIETRKRIIRALVELTREGEVSPTAQGVSQRAQVGLRTVFRHFDDMETLYREVHEELQVVISLVPQIQYQPERWRDGLLEHVRSRCRLYEDLTPFFLAGRVHRHESVFIDDKMRQRVAIDRAILNRYLPRTVQRDRPRREAILMAMSPDAWVRLRRDQGLSYAAAVAAVELLVLTLV